MLVALDFETSSLNYWQKDFRVLSLALAYRNTENKIVTKFTQDAAEIVAYLEKIKEEGHTILVYNYGFEGGVYRCCYPGLEPESVVDVMRLRQLRERVEKCVGYGLKAAVKMHLPGMAGYEEEVHEWIRANIPEAKKGKLGEHLGKAPYDILARYNTADVVATLKLYEAFTKHFESINFDWQPDHQLYIGQANQLIGATVRGIKVDAGHLERFVADVEDEVETIDDKFNQRFAKEITEIREELRAKKQATYKKKIVTDLPPFNISSKNHLERLFIGKLGIEPELFTPKMRPSFKSAHMGLYGVGGKMLASRGKRLIVQGQAKGLIKHVQENNGRYHPTLKLVGTATGRLAGSGGINLQGLSRKEHGVMDALLADEGRVVIEIDLVAGEPTLTAHYSQDYRYMYANFTGKGKRPYEQDGVLFIDDCYLMWGSVCGIYTEELWKAWREGFDGESFADAWMRDPEYVKSKLKRFRKTWKWTFLACSYELQGRKLRIQAKAQDGLDISIDEANEIVKRYWELFSGVRKAADKQKAICKRNGYIKNTFGFLCYPKAPYAALNGKIQSEVSGIISWLVCLVTEREPDLQLVTIIHDAILISCTEDRVEHVRQAVKEALLIINDTLRWTTRIETGFCVGKHWGELK